MNEKIKNGDCTCPEPNHHNSDADMYLLHSHYSKNQSSIEDELFSKWSIKKKNSVLLSDVYDDLNDIHHDAFFERRSEKISNCGSYLEFKVNPNDRTDKHLFKAYFCKDRLCPMCNWRRSLKLFGQLSKITDFIDHNYNYEYIFLTLTIKNVPFDELDQGVKTIKKGLRTLTHKNTDFQKIALGTYSTLEITYNKKTSEWHPHIHMLVVVEKSYFHKHYISSAAWSEIWQKCIDSDYVPIIYVQKVNGKKYKGISELTKYMAKDADYLISDNYNETLNKVFQLSKSVARKRLVSKTGLIKDVHKMLNLDDSEDGNLINTDNDVLNPTVTYLIEKYHWKSGVYVKM